MKLPPIQGTFDQQEFFIYAACDHAYFEDFGYSFIRSIRANTNHNIHVHVFNPTAEQIEYCQRNGIGITWEHAHQTLFTAATQRWNRTITQETERKQLERTMNAMNKGQDHSLNERIQKTYFACARFIRLAQLCAGHRLLAVDIDAVVRQDFPVLGSQHDFYIHHITGKRARYLAGGLWLNGTAQCQEFLGEYANQLIRHFEQDHVYWGLDQDVLDPIVPKFNHGQLPMQYIDWNMSPDSYIWTAKGLRKHLAAFVSEQQKYSV